MNKKLMFLTKMSLKKKVVTKWFLIANIIFLIAIAGLLNIDSIVKAFGGDFNDEVKILVIDNTDNTYNSFINNYEGTSKYVEDMVPTKVIKYNKTYNKAKKEIKDTNDIILVIDKDETNFIKASITSDSEISTVLSQVINNSLNTTKYNIALENFNIDKTKLTLIEKQIEIQKIRIDNQNNNEEVEEIITGIIIPIMILPFFMLTLFLVQMIGAEVNEEKTTKSMEIIISNVPPKTHFLSKILAGNLFVLIQGILLFSYVLIGFLIRLLIGGNVLNNEVGGLFNEVSSVLSNIGFFNNLGINIGLTLILMILTFIGYSLVSGILASMTTNIEDYQQVQAPIMIVSVIGYYLAFMASLFKGSLFIKIVSFIPFISALLSPSLLLLGQIGITEMIISITIMLIAIFLLVKYGLKIYKVGILNYSQSGLWKKIFSSVKNK